MIKLDSEPVSRKPSKVSEQRIWRFLVQIVEDGSAPLNATTAEPGAAALELGYVSCEGAAFVLTKRGEVWLRARDPRTAREWTHQGITYAANEAAKDLGRDAGMAAKEALSAIVLAVHAERDALARIARAHGRSHPWDAIAVLVRQAKGRQ